MNDRPAWLIEREIVIEGQTIIYSYDAEGDVLEIIFEQGGGVGLNLTENIILRYNQKSQKPLSLIFTSFSQLTKPTPFGPPSFHLAALSELPPEMQDTVLHFLTSFPVNCFLRVSGLRLTPDGELQPITYLNQPAEMPFDKVLA
jgi:hypothetical protein